LVVLQDTNQPKKMVPRYLNHTKKKSNSFYGVKNWKEVTETFREKIMCVTYIWKKNSSSRTLKIVVLHWVAWNWEIMPYQPFFLVSFSSSILTVFEMKLF
jgi:hypothetical protein